MDLTYCKRQIEALVEYKQISEMKYHISDQEKERIMKQANELMQQIFTFDKPWDMERCTIPYQLDPMDWNVQCHDDEEWCFMLNRMDYLNYLMLASELTNDLRYQTKGKELILHWIHAHPNIIPTCSTRTLDTGIRILNMVETLPYIYKSGNISEEELEKIINHIDLQIQYLKDQYLTKYTLSNWGSIQTCAICSILPMYLPNYQTNEIYQWACKEMETQFAIQIYDDGMQWEQSTMYHIEVCNYGMKALYYDRFYQIASSPILKEQVWKMLDALFHQATPSFEIETFGDSDRVSIKDVMVRGATMFQESTWKFAGYPVYDMESLYAFGITYANQYETLPTQLPNKTYFDGEDSGMYTIRSDWSKNASFTMFTNGSLGSGHGHSDNLHISLYHKGIPVLIDPGRYTYREDHPLRVELKSMQAHNVVILDKKACSKPSDSWGYQDFSIPCKNYVRHHKNIHYIEGHLIGHDPLQIWTRKVIVIDPSIWLLVDEIKEDGIHEMCTYYHFDPKITTRIEKDHIVIQGDTTLHLYYEGEAKQTKGQCSLRYNEAKDHDMITLHSNFTNACQRTTMFCDPNIRVTPVEILQNNDTPLSKDIANAYRFELSNKEAYTVAVFQKELYQGKKICTCEGMPFHAKCIVIHENEGKKELIRLRT